MFQDILILRQHPLFHSHCIIYLLIPTSNHNKPFKVAPQRCIVYLLIPTSNHNYIAIRAIRPMVVYLLIPTSNHNLKQLGNALHTLYIF